MPQRVSSDEWVLSQEGTEIRTLFTSNRVVSTISRILQSVKSVSMYYSCGKEEPVTAMPADSLVLGLEVIVESTQVVCSFFVDSDLHELDSELEGRHLDLVKTLRSVDNDHLGALSSVRCAV